MDYYTQIAEGYDELHGKEQSNKISIIKKNIEIDQNAKILDVGCGTGISSDFDCFVVGIDPSRGLLNKNRKIKVLGSAENLPFKDKSFDYVISVTAIHNFKNIEKAFEEIKRVGKNKFAFSVLKRSTKLGYIKNLIEKKFKIDKVIDEGIDVIYFCSQF